MLFRLFYLWAIGIAKFGSQFLFLYLFRRPATCSQDPEISNSLACTSGSREQVAGRWQYVGRRDLKCRQVLLAVLSVLCAYTAYAESATHHPQDFLASIQGKPDEGKQIVQHFCANCHAVKPLIALGAPRMGQKADWLTRVNQGLETLFKHTTEGYNAMPPRGGCFECSDEQLKKAIQFMLPPTLSKGK